MRRCVADILREMPERHLFLRGLRAWSGFRQTGILYERGSRAAGRTKYSFARLVALAVDGLFSLTTLPLRVATYVGFAAMVFSTAMGLVTLAWWVGGFRFMGHTAAELPGWTTLAGGMFFFGGLQLMILGCIGEYVGRIYTEVKQRPRWIVREAIGLGPLPSRPIPDSSREAGLRRN